MEQNQHHLSKSEKIRKKFLPGQLVLHRQLQVNTRSGGALKLLFTGPYVIESIDKDVSSAVIEHMQTGRELNAHFRNIQLFNIDPDSTRLPHNFHDQIDHLFLEKYSLAHYHHSQLEKGKFETIEKQL